MGLKADSLKAAVSAIASTGLRFALFAVLARQLSTERVGDFSMAQWIAEITALACSLGVTTVASRYLPQLQGSAVQRRIFNRLWLRWAIVVTSFAALVGSCVSFWTSPSSDWPTHALVGIWSVGAMAFALHLSVLTGIRRFDLIVRANITFGVSALALVVLAELVLSDQLALYSAMILAYAVAILVTVKPIAAVITDALQPRSSTKFDVDLRNVRQYALNSCFTGTLWALALSRGELPVLAHFHNAHDVAMFSAAAVLAGGATQFTMLGVSALGPYLTHLWFTENRSAALALSKSAMSLQLLLSASIAVVLVLFGRELLNVAFGPDYEDAAPTLAILSLTIPALSVAAQSHLIQIRSDGRLNRNVMIVVVLILYAAAFLLIPSLSSAGAAYARLIAISVNFIAVSVLSAKMFGTGSIDLQSISFTAAACALATVIGQANLSIAPRLLFLASILLVLLVLVRDSTGRPVISRLVR